MTALAHLMGLACIFKRHRCGDSREEPAGYQQLIWQLVMKMREDRDLGHWPETN